jgi:hypothetical protein
MKQMEGRAIGHFGLGDGRIVNCTVRADPRGYVLTDKRGRRFAAETATGPWPDQHRIDDVAA